MIISVINNKGGVGKTTTTVNLGHALARVGQRVLVVDVDSQCNASDLLLSLDARPRRTLYDLLDSEESISAPDCINGTMYPDLFLLPNSSDTAAIEPHLITSAPSSLTLLRRKLREYALENFDFTLIDNPPNLGTFVILSLYCSDFAIVPTEAGSKHSGEGLIKAVDFINEVRATGNADLRFLKLLLTKVDKRTAISKAIVAQIRQLFSREKVFDVQIPINTALQQAEYKSQTIFKYRSNAIAAKAYQNLAKELLKLLGDHQRR